LEAKYKMGLFDDPYRYLDEERASKEIFTAEHKQAARKFAEHSFVLLKNENQVLPLKKTGTIALVGPLAENQRNMLGTWSVSGDWQQSVSVATGIKNLIGNSAKIIYAKGANISDNTMVIKRVNTLGEEIVPDPNKSPQQLIDEAVQAANSADIVVAVVGEAADMSGESSSRSDIGIPESQENLIKALVQTGKPVVLVVFSGRPLTLNWEDKHVTAMLEVWFPGTEAGNAIANVLFGNYNPSGKLTATFPRSVGQIPNYYNHLNTGRPYEEGGPTKFKSDYLDITNDPLYPFGYGLSYTTFSYGNIKVNKTDLKGNETLTASVLVTNTGTYAGEETVQLYISDPVASISRNVEDLKGFKKVILQPGESKDISFNINTDLLKFYNSDLNYTWEPGEFIIRIGTNSRDTKSVRINWSK
jgi:beta-glucosidase